MKDWDESEESKYLMYFDVNGLYGWTMCESLPLANYEWIEEFSIDEILQTKDDGNVGYFLEVDLDYPISLHDTHNDYPMCAERMSIGKSKQEKLILNLNHKKNYVLHYRTLKLVLKHGLVLKNVHKVLKFEQSKWLKSFIELNQRMRLSCKNPFEKFLYKLVSNSIYGKFLENKKKWKDIKLVNNWEGRYGAQSLISRPNFKGTKIFNENLVAIELNKVNVKIDKPMIIGVAVLEISKVLMYDFHYGFMLKKYDYNKCKMAYTDTDSFVYCIHDDDAYNLINENKDKFDDKKPGLMKDENCGNIMVEFVGLRAKMYSYRVQKQKNMMIESKRAKGIKKHIVNKKLTFDDFKQCILQHTSLTGSQSLIKSSFHKVYTINQNKVFLDGSDDKRFISNENCTLAWGHYNIEKK